jgi:hypothetical protein
VGPGGPSRQGLRLAWPVTEVLEIRVEASPGMSVDTHSGGSLI